MRDILAVEEIAEILEGKIIGDKDYKIEKVSLLLKGDDKSLSILKEKKDYKDLDKSNSKVIVCDQDISRLYPNKIFIIMKKVNPYHLNNLFRIYKYKKYNLFNRENTSKERDIYIGQDVKIGKNCLFMPGVRIMNGVEIGDNVCIHCNTVIKEGTKIGNNVLIDSNCSIGNYSFEYVWDGEEFIRLESVGEVIIEDDVEIGSNTTIDRGTIGDTIIGKRSKIDNLVQIGHEVEIGKDCIIVSQTGIAGWVKIGDRVALHGQSGIRGGVEIGHNSVVQAQAGITKSIKSNSIVTGFPAENRNEYYKKQAIINKIIKKYKEIENEKGESKSIKSRLRDFFNKI